MGTQEQFEEAVQQVIETVSFHSDNKVQVFELNIRALGGLVRSFFYFYYYDFYSHAFNFSFRLICLPLNPHSIIP